MTSDIWIWHVNKISLKASQQISALQRPTSLRDLPSSFIVSNFNDIPLLCLFRSWGRIIWMQKPQERAFRFVLEESISDYKTLFLKGDANSFRISSLKLRQKKFTRFLTHFWNLFSHDIKNALILNNLNTLMRKRVVQLAGVQCAWWSSKLEITVSSRLHVWVFVSCASVWIHILHRHAYTHTHHRHGYLYIYIYIHTHIYISVCVSSMIMLVCMFCFISSVCLKICLYILTIKHQLCM